jgi:hypothetical protein
MTAFSAKLDMSLFPHYQTGGLEISFVLRRGRETNGKETEIVVGRYRYEAG